MSRLRTAVLVAATLGALLTLAAPASAAPVQHGRAILAFLPDRDRGVEAPLPGDPQYDPPAVLATLNSEASLALGLSSAVQGGYEQDQAFLDITQGTRISTAAYKPVNVPALTFYPFDHDRQALFAGFLDVKDRAASAPAQIYPGLLGQLIPGGTAYAGVTSSSSDNIEALAAVNETGRISDVSLGHSDTVAARGLALLAQRRFVVIGLPPAQSGAAQLDYLLRHRPADTLVIAMQSPPPVAAPQLLPTGVAGLGQGALTSTSTTLPGVIAGIDVLPTILDRVGVPIPDSVKGQPIRVEGTRDQGALESLTKRLRVVGPQRFPTLEAVLAAWLAVLLACGLVADRRGYRAALRVGALAAMWILPMLLVTAKLSPSKGAEILIVVLGTFLLGLLSDRLLPWPRAPLVPCAVTIVAYAVDLAFGSPLIIRSLLGSNPLFGSRFYGIGNELESILPVLLFVAIAAYLDRRPRGRSMIAWFALGSLFLGVVVGSGRLGADVGGVITIGGGAAVAVLFSLPGGITKRAVGIAVLVPIFALVLLAVLDTATGGDGHFTRTVLHADGESALQDIVVNRFTLAYHQLIRGGMPFATAIALLGIAYAVRYRDRVFGPLEGRAAWTAAFCGSVASSVVGSLANDSGPVLLVIGTTAAAFAVAYVRGDPRLAAAPGNARVRVQGADQ